MYSPLLSDDDDAYDNDDENQNKNGEYEDGTNKKIIFILSNYWVLSIGAIILTLWEIEWSPGGYVSFKVEGLMFKVKRSKLKTVLLNRIATAFNILRGLEDLISSLVLMQTIWSQAWGLLWRKAPDLDPHLQCLTPS